MDNNLLKDACMSKLSSPLSFSFFAEVLAKLVSFSSVYRFP